MPKRRFFDIAAFPLSGPDVYRALLVKYSIIIVYSGLSFLVGGVPSVRVAAGYPFALFWAAAMAAATSFALAGVVRSRHTGKTTMEFIGTLLLLAGMCGYFAAILWRTIIHVDLLIAPSALLPVILSVFPFFRIRSIVKRPHGGPPATPIVSTGPVPVVADAVIVPGEGGDPGGADGD